MATSREHGYAVQVRWTGNRGEGTSSYRGYERNHEIKVGDKPVISGSSDPAFRGDRSRYNPEELLVASLSACHMLWYLHLCANAGIVVTAYSDDATGTMVETVGGGGQFSEVVLKPAVSIEEGGINDWPGICMRKPTSAASSLILSISRSDANPRSRWPDVYEDAVSRIGGETFAKKNLRQPFMRMKGEGHLIYSLLRLKCELG